MTITGWFSNSTIAVLLVFDNEICSNDEVLLVVRKAAISSVVTAPDKLRIITDVRTKCVFNCSKLSSVMFGLTLPSSSQ